MTFTDSRVDNTGSSGVYRLGDDGTALDFPQRQPAADRHRQRH